MNHTETEKRSGDRNVQATANADAAPEDAWGLCPSAKSEGQRDAVRTGRSPASGAAGFHFSMRTVPPSVMSMSALLRRASFQPEGSSVSSVGAPVTPAVV